MRLLQRQQELPPNIGMLKPPVSGELKSLRRKSWLQQRTQITTIKVRKHDWTFHFSSSLTFILQIASAETSDGEISNCSSFEANPNDCTFIPTTALSKPKGVARNISKSSPQKRKSNALTSGSIRTSPRKQKRVCKSQITSCVGYTMASVLTTWDATTEYGISFRNLPMEEQEVEIKRLNMVSLKGQREA